MFCSIQVTGPVLQELLGSWTQLETLHATFVSAPFDVTDLSKLKELKEVKLKASAGSNIQVQNTFRSLSQFFLQLVIHAISENWSQVHD